METRETRQQIHCQCGKRLFDVAQAAGTVVVQQKCRDCKRVMQISISPAAVKVELAVITATLQRRPSRSSSWAIN